MVEKYLSGTDIKKLLQCSRCKKVPNNPPIYMCKTGHHECSTCFVKHSDTVLIEETDASTDTESESGSTGKDENKIGVIFPTSSKKKPFKQICAICKHEVTKTRNLLAECLLKQLESAKPESRIEKTSYPSSMKINVQETKVSNNFVDCCYNIYGSPCQRYDPQDLSLSAYDPNPYSRYPVTCTVPQYTFPMNPYVMTESQPGFEYADPNAYYPEYVNMSYYNSFSRKDLSDRKNKLMFTQQGNAICLNGEPSKRPIRCPTHLCGRNIAVAALSSHFCFDHPEVPPLNVDFNVTCHLFIDPEMIPHDYGRCVAILLIPYKCDGMSTVSTTNFLSASKIKNSLPLVVMASKLHCSTPSYTSIQDINGESQSESLSRGDFEKNENDKSNLLIIWLAGVDTQNSVYTTIQVTEKTTNMRSMVYTGPITSLRYSQNPNKVFEQGDCLVIHSGILDNIVGDKGGFDLHVIVH